VSVPTLSSETHLDEIFGLECKYRVLTHKSTHVRALLGCDRIGYAELPDSLDRGHCGTTSTVRRCGKSASAGREGQAIRTHEKDPKTPVQGVLESNALKILLRTVEALTSILSTLVLDFACPTCFVLTSEKTRSIE
jgi:hypothetical protein